MPRMGNKYHSETIFLRKSSLMVFLLSITTAFTNGKGLSQLLFMIVITNIYVRNSAGWIKTRVPRFWTTLSLIKCLKIEIQHPAF